ncbi:MAG: type I 3-dehydroquinate dehydratase [Akkermansiaceae bacterium]|nr:type I 3-dehydroquinate dehydratase [Akkermansiaceae bacterium]
MTQSDFRLDTGRTNVVGSFGDGRSLATADPQATAEACDLVEIRLDLLDTAYRGVPERIWGHLAGLPLLFTARRGDEGGAGNLGADTRARMLEAALEDAACVDIEVASIGEMKPTIGLLADRRIPWIASFHDFTKLPDDAVLTDRLEQARDAGAAAFKVAAKLNETTDLARLADFQLADHGIAVASMGMGPLAPVSRLLCAQCGSVLNYGFLGETATAPGQWDAALLKRCIARTVSLRGS